ncbi:pirin family protein [Pectobacterium zantedeschiae]|uniref:Pirin family protein n=1 Tax=Pectobacterium zantedeschiae TaxID=2034769 RepID=A0A9X8JLJ4_9GAMM|nr:pirin family protein [Pectobacterium zantedeschiae]RYC37376.1 pirin family protein [Pectobacterium zantedeschiae]RYC42624.1 pirin family protein [Pectobacterium zantedeschiae]RYC45863.1 pirin family protein [Pectobacterium zantedeschiae]RYC47082.1 pirin family protein [Pectobacterium zantedeschiae]
MITRRAAGQCGQADYGWLQARYTFSFGHYFDPQLLGYASLRVLNQEVLAPGASFQPRTYPRVDILNIILQGEAEYRDSNGCHIQAKAGDVLLLATQPNVSYSEHNTNASKSLTRLQLWLNACQTRENSPLQRMGLDSSNHTLLASPEGEQDSLQLRQQVWIHHVDLQSNEQSTIALQGNQAYLQLIHGSMVVKGNQHCETLHCGDGAFIKEETTLTLQAESPLRALLIDLVV